MEKKMIRGKMVQSQTETSPIILPSIILPRLSPFPRVIGEHTLDRTSTRDSKGVTAKRSRFRAERSQEAASFAG
jgi:hypothetical protein